MSACCRRGQALTISSILVESNLYLIVTMVPAGKLCALEWELQVTLLVPVISVESFRLKILRTTSS